MIQNAIHGVVLIMPVYIHFRAATIILIVTLIVVTRGIAFPRGIASHAIHHTIAQNLIVAEIGNA